MARYREDRLMALQHAIVLQCLKDIQTPEKRVYYWEEVMASLELYAPLYHMTPSEMVKSAIRSGYIKGMKESEVDGYGRH